MVFLQTQSKACFMRYFKGIFLLLFLYGSSVFSQSQDLLFDLAQPSPSGGVAVMQPDTLLTSLLALQREVNQSKGGVDGFTIRLYRGNNIQTARDEAAEVKAMFLLKYPDEAVDMEYETPNWFVRVGSFKTYGEALKMRNELERELSQIKDFISIVPTTVKIN